MSLYLRRDEIIVLAEDDDTYYIDEDALRKLKSKPYFEPPDQFVADGLVQHSEHILMCGWRRDVDDIIVLLNELAPPGGELHMVNEIPMTVREVHRTEILRRGFKSSLTVVWIFAILKWQNRMRIIQIISGSWTPIQTILVRGAAI